MLEQTRKFFNKRKEIVLAYRRLFRTPDGEKVLKDLLDVCGYARSSFDNDTNKMAFYEGQRSVILRLVKTVNMTENDVLHMLRHIEKAEEQDEFAR